MLIKTVRNAAAQNFKATLLAQVEEEKRQRQARPVLDFDRLRALGPDLIRVLNEKHIQAKEAGGEVQGYAAELGVLVDEVNGCLGALEKAQEEWRLAPLGALVWRPGAQMKAASLREAGMSLRDDVARRVPDTADEPMRSCRTGCGVGEETDRSPLAVFDLATLQLQTLKDPVMVELLTARGVDVEPHRKRIEPALEALGRERALGIGPKKGTAREARDDAQVTLEILLSRTVSKVGAALGPQEARRLDASLPRVPSTSKKRRKKKKAATPGSQGAAASSSTTSAGENGNSTTGNPPVVH